MSRELPPLNALRAFEVAARLQSVSLAADELHVTHGAVSRQIRALEAQLGVALFVKDGRGVKLTEAGMRLRDVAFDTFERLREVCAELQRQTRDAPFVLGCPGSLLARWFIPRLDRLNRELPELHLQLSSSEGDLDPRRPGLDATLLFAEPPWPADMQVYELASEAIGPVLSPRHVRASQLQHAAPAALLAEPLLYTSSRPQAWPAWAERNGLAPQALTLGQGFEHL
ncbi:MAG: LysR family transcriptional regulator, partial [Pseudomonas sp.]|nr:LysR family transcriptional regulator [Pseudomonas sp.]